MRIREAPTSSSAPEISQAQEIASKTLSPVDRRSNQNATLGRLFASAPPTMTVVSS
jgi:hypothetical protein